MHTNITSHLALTWILDSRRERGRGREVGGGGREEGGLHLPQKRCTRIITSQISPRTSQHIPAYIQILKLIDISLYIIQKSTPPHINSKLCNHGDTTYFTFHTPICKPIPFTCPYTHPMHPHNPPTVPSTCPSHSHAHHPPHTHLSRPGPGARSSASAVPQRSRPSEFRGRLHCLRSEWVGPQISCVIIN